VDIAAVNLTVHENRWHVPCVDCGALIYLPSVLSPREVKERTMRGEKVALSSIMTQDAVQHAIEGHVRLNPDIHPSLVKLKHCRHLRCMLTRTALRFVEWQLRRSQR
jgi:hypothetical protein